MAKFKAGSLRYKGKTIKEADNEDGRAYFTYSNAAVEVSNYFSKVGRLLERNLVDGDLYFVFLGRIIKDCYEVCEQIAFSEKWNWSLSGFKILRDGAAKWLERP